MCLYFVAQTAYEGALKNYFNAMAILNQRFVKIFKTNFVVYEEITTIF